MKTIKSLILIMILMLTAAAWPSVPAYASLALNLSDFAVEQGRNVMIYYDLPEDGETKLSLYADGTLLGVIFSEKQEAGFHEFEWNGLLEGVALSDGTHELELEQNGNSIRMAIVITVNNELQKDFAAPEPAAAPSQDADTGSQELYAAGLSITPAVRSLHKPKHSHKGCYWCTPMDISDEEAVWAMLTSPIYTINENQKLQIIVRAEPSDSSEGVGVITGTSMGIHVLENLKNGWSLIECYSASFFDSKVKAWNQFITGYVKTSLIQKKTPNQEMGIVIDKLTQTLYVFRNGHLFTTLAVSTGLYNQKQPYNETRSGEFLLVSKVGDFRSDAMICSYAIRFNGGDLLHEVPHVKNADGGKNYKSTEYKLGTRGSHGCIRVQRLKNADGINMKWLWNNLRVNAQNGVKIVIWEDFQGRQIQLPADDSLLYYNSANGSYYHKVDNCPGVRQQYLPLTAFTYGELDSDRFSKLTPCPNCQPPRRKAEIEAVNLIHQTSSPGMVSDYHNP